KFVRGKERAVRVHDAEAVGVSVGGQAQLRLFLPHRLVQEFQVVRLGRGTQAPEKDIPLGVQDRQLRAGAPQKLVQVAPSCSPEHIGGDANFFSFNKARVDEGFQVFEIGGKRVMGNNEALFQSRDIPRHL